MATKSEIIVQAFKALRAGVLPEAKAIISENYPFKSLEKEGRTYREHQKTKIFLRDGFVDRYSGERLGWIACVVHGIYFGEPRDVGRWLYQFLVSGVKAGKRDIINPPDARSSHR